MSKYYGSTDAMRKAVNKYHSEKIETISVRVPKGQKEYYKKIADNVGQSLNQFAIQSMNERIDRENLSDI